MVIKHTVTSQTQITGWSPWPDFCFHNGTWWRTNKERPWTSVQEHSRWNTEILSSILDRMFFGSPRSHHSVLVRDENHKELFQRGGSLFSDRLTELPNIFLTAETDTRSNKTQIEVEPVGEPVEHVLCDRSVHKQQLIRCSLPSERGSVSSCPTHGRVLLLN